MNSAAPLTASSIVLSKSWLPSSFGSCQILTAPMRPACFLRNAQPSECNLKRALAASYHAHRFAGGQGKPVAAQGANQQGSQKIHAHVAAIHLTHGYHLLTSIKRAAASPARSNWRGLA